MRLPTPTEPLNPDLESVWGNSSVGSTEVAADDAAQGADGQADAEGGEGQ